MILENSRNHCFTAILAVSIIVFLSLSPVLKNDFVTWDDPAHLLNNKSVRNLSIENLKEIFTSDVYGVYIPLTVLSFSFEYHFFNYNPFIYHFNNLLIHCIIVALIFFVGLRLKLSMLSSAFAALIFGIHPMHVESVAWVTERKDVLYSLFYLASILSYLKYLDLLPPWDEIIQKKIIPSRSSCFLSGQTQEKFERRGASKYIYFSFVFAVLSLLAKPMALSIPLILLLIDWFYGRKIDLRVIVEKIPFFIIAASIGCITFLHHARIPSYNLAHSFLIWPWTFIFHLRHFIFPVILVPLYRLSHPLSIYNIDYFLSLCSFISILFSLIYLRKYKLFIFAFGFYFFSIFFLLRFDVSMDTNIVADRWMYLPSLGFCYLLGAGVHRIIDWANKKEGSKKKALVVIFIIIFITGLFLKTRHQSRVWKNTGTLWLHQLKFFPNEPIALSNMATFLREIDDFKKAEYGYREFYLQASGQNKNFKNRNFEIMLQKVGVIINLYKRAATVMDQSPDAHYNLARYYEDLGMYQEAFESYSDCVLIFPSYKDAYDRRAKIDKMLSYADNPPALN